MKKLLALTATVIFTLPTIASASTVKCDTQTKRFDGYDITIKHCDVELTSSKPLNILVSVDNNRSEELNVIVSFNNKQTLVNAKPGESKNLLNVENYSSTVDRLAFNFKPSDDIIQTFTN